MRRPGAALHKRVAKCSKSEASIEAPMTIMFGEGMAATQAPGSRSIISSVSKYQLNNLVL